MAIVWDLETGPNLNIEVEPPPEFDRNAVLEKLHQKYKKPETIAKHLADEVEKHNELIANWNDTATSDWPLRPAYGEIVAGSFVNSKDDSVVAMIVGKDGVTEQSIVDECFKSFVYCQKAGLKMVGFNSEGFDLPFLVQRAFCHGRPIPLGFFSIQGKWLNWSSIHFDLAKLSLLGRHYSQCKWSFEEMAKLMGTKGKNGVDGSQIWEMIRDGKTDEVEEYIKQDVLQPLCWLRRIAKSAGPEVFYDLEL